MASSYVPTWCRGWYESLRDALQDSLEDPKARPLPLILATSAGLVSGYLIYKSWRDRGKNFPPTPCAWPLIGSMLELSEDNIHGDLVRIQQKNNLPDVYKLKAGPSSFVVLNSFDAIKDAFITHGSVFLERPPMKAFTLTGFREDLDSYVLKEKSFIMTCLKNAGMGQAKSVEGKVLDELHKLHELLDPLIEDDKPIGLEDLLPKLTGNIQFSILFNKVYPLDDAELAKRVETLEQWYKSLSFFAYMDMMPMWLGKLMFRSGLKELQKRVDDVGASIDADIDQHVKNFDADDPKDYVDQFLMRKAGDVDFQLLNNSLFLFMPDGILTNASMMLWCILFMTTHQEIQKRLHQELDALTGGSRDIVYSDKDKLPLVEAFIMETFRIRPPATLTSYTTTGDTTIRGFYVAKGTTVMANLHAAMNDPKRYKDPLVFNPDRFIKDDGTLARDEGWIPFGIGARKCTGEATVKLTVFLFLANLFQRYSFTFPDDTPKPALEKAPGLVSSPQPFKVVVKLRT